MRIEVLSILFITQVLANVVVEPPCGPIIGLEKTSTGGKNYNVFHTIRFGKAPTGTNRFMASELEEPWTELYNATLQKQNICFQLSANRADSESEDCLFLTVFTPQDSISGNKSYPVIVNIYGGGFNTGSGKIGSSGPPTYLVDEDIIVVYFNYRVSVFGFLSTGDNVIPGNAGLSDQITALKWVQTNIAAFGGDPKQVTISGQSAGAKSVGYLLLSPLATGLFSAAIMESGSPLCAGGYQRNHTEIAFKTGSFLDSQFETSKNSSQLLDTMQNADAKSVADAAYSFAHWAGSQDNYLERNPFYQGYYFTPTIDASSSNPILPEAQYEALSKGNIHKVPVLMGICSEEGLIDGTFRDDSYRKAFDKNPTLLNPQDMNIQGEADWVQVGVAIKNIYSPNSSYFDNALAVLQYQTDQEYARGSIKHAQIQSNFTDVFYYQFSFTGKLDGGNQGFPGSGNVSHVSEGVYIYSGHSHANYTESDELISKRLVKIWTNFAKYRNPTYEPEDLLQNITWPKVQPNRFSYVNIGNYEITDLEILEGKPKGARMDPWDDLYNNYGHRPFDTY